MADNISPEEKLLRLIRNEQKQRLPAEKQSMLQTGRVPPLPEPSVQTKTGHAKIKPQHIISLRLNPGKIVLICFFASLAYLTGSLIYPLINSPSINISDIKEKPGIVQKPVISSSPIKPLEYYQTGINNEQMFHSQAALETSTSMASVNHDLLKDINLVGVIAGDNPQAIIEDKKTEKTYYVSKGQCIGELMVEEILDGKIILNHKGQKFELYL
ncbi:MAG: hypothetical protein WDL87_05620 [Candidatus Omnitrophota bacterium]|jgi:hypothetical protein